MRKSWWTWSAIVLIAVVATVAIWYFDDGDIRAAEAQLRQGGLRWEPRPSDLDDDLDAARRAYRALIATRDWRQLADELDRSGRCFDRIAERSPSSLLMVPIGYEAAISAQAARAGWPTGSERAAVLAGLDGWQRRADALATLAFQARLRGDMAGRILDMARDPWRDYAMIGVQLPTIVTVPVIGSLVLRWSRPHMLRHAVGALLDPDA